MITISCTNNGKDYEIQQGQDLKTLSDKICKTIKDPKTNNSYPVLAAYVDHKLKELSYTVFYPHNIEFIGYNTLDGKRTYMRSLSFLLESAVREVFPCMILVIDHSLPSGMFCEIVDVKNHTEDGHSIIHIPSSEDILKLKAVMRRKVEEDIPFRKEKILAEKAEKIFENNNQVYKSALQKSLGRYFCSVYYLGDDADSFHGPLVPSTGYLQTFELLPFGEGFCLQYPSDADYSKVIPYREQGKMAATLKDYSTWCRTTGIIGVSTLNKTLLEGGAVELINLAEARQERNYAAIADQIYAEKDRTKIVFIAGPSSSGKTSSSLRIAQQCKVLGLVPKVIELDNYFIDREFTPKDEDGNPDFECLEAMDLQLLNDNLNDLLAGKRVEIPKYDFKQGKKIWKGNFLQLDEKDILIMEGIHALDPAMVPDVDQSHIFRVYASALTSLNLDENNNISTSDNRMLRRIVRDFNYRGHTPENTILGWPSVRRGENKYIFPFQENADALFNSALLYELPLLKYYAEPLLRRILPNSPAYSEAVRLLKFLEYIVALQPSEIAAIPPTSIMREFIGGQTL